MCVITELILQAGVKTNLGNIQRSKCRPLFYDLYSNNRNLLCSCDENILFGDDTYLVYTDESLELLANHVN